MSDVEFIGVEFAIFRNYHDPFVSSARALYLYANGAWLILSIGGMDETASAHSFDKMPKRGIFRSDYPPLSKASLLLGVDAENFRGFSLQAEGRLIYLQADRCVPCWPYFSSPRQTFVSQLETYNGRSAGGPSD